MQTKINWLPRTSQTSSEVWGQCNPPGWYHFCRTSVNQFGSIPALYCSCSCSLHDPRSRDRVFPHSVLSTFQSLDLSNSFPFLLPWVTGLLECFSHQLKQRELSRLVTFWAGELPVRSPSCDRRLFAVVRKHFLMSQQHWKLVNIVFMLTKVGNTCFGCKICVQEANMFLYLFQSRKNLSPQHVFRAAKLRNICLHNIS